ncbi:hypothetical protein PACID_30480 [Acidipropionibacterium acidipropionici ATCC 4875]|uniref:Uncharacterized protein n=1 Tax=Acidipropionibacterium acidipropionici (strain ATCC 4875 / DSM 20272 / JCM 6432 / NBRC 12425 / NCIMB 8070 / 4) TaxID=1171373 RepID=K7S8B4_ACIA4|nr:hypothetical protein PACID_30480 [Acidipropionibacterium acidipropionici ATCC 4875]
MSTEGATPPRSRRRSLPPRAVTGPVVGSVSRARRSGSGLRPRPGAACSGGDRPGEGVGVAGPALRFRSASASGCCCPGRGGVWRR